MIWKPFLVEEQIHIDALFSFFIEKQPEGFHFPGETHNFWECLYVLDGTTCVSGGDKVYDLSKGDLIFHKPMELHKFYIDSKGGASLLIFSFSLKGPLSDYFEDKVFHLNDEQATIMRELLSYCLKEEKKNPPVPPKEREERFLRATDSPLHLQRITTFLHQLLLSLGDAEGILQASTDSDALLFKRAVQYMKEHIKNNLTVPEIARFLGLSESGLKRIFSKYAGISIHKYFMTLKFQEAYELFQKGKTVSEVSELLNFSSQSYFSTSFKKEFGKNPSEFKLFPEA